MRKPYLTHTHKHYKVKAKDLQKKDRISAFGQQLVVVSNKKNDMNGRVLLLERAYGVRLKEPILAIVPKNFKVSVTENSLKSNPKNR